MIFQTYRLNICTKGGINILKLSMWMIANRLSSLDLELNISENAKPVLKSARSVYATNCVHVYQSGNDVICNGEGDLIRIKDARVTEAFEIVQCVFDFYEDWFTNIAELIRKKNYREVVNECWPVFHNPLILFDGNCRVLGLSEQYEEDDMDEEWKYLSAYGYSSLDAISYMRYNSLNQDFTRMGMQKFSFEGNMNYPGITYSLYSDEMLCGRLNLLEKERSLNPGDYQILELLANCLKSGLAEQETDTPDDRKTNLFYNLLDGKQVNDHHLSIQLTYQGWQKDDTYQIFLLEADSPENDKSIMEMLALTIMQHLSSCCILQRFPYLIILCDIDRYKGAMIKEILLSLTKGGNIRIACSLSSQGIRNCSFLLKQASAAIEYGRLLTPEIYYFEFFDHAMDYIIESSSLEDSVQACHPDVYDLWKKRRKNHDEMFDTLKCYLNNERSLVNTAQALFVHRNTLVYRVHKLTELLHDNLDDIYTRDYIKLSIRTLELFEQKFLNTKKQH